MFTLIITTYEASDDSGLPLHPHTHSISGFASEALATNAGGEYIRKASNIHLSCMCVVVDMDNE